MRMLSFDMKRKINTLRDILVGKIPDPKSQVEQITIAMVFKFMDDMDKEFLEDEFFGGERKFFVDTDKEKYSKYAWSNLMNPQMAGQRADLYRDGIEKMYMNPNLPDFFREVFRNAYIPFRDTETINLFLKEINEFSYDNSEDLGEAFEMLLSIMSSQGDAGQFRTPRHIIDMIVDIVQPQKNDKILDPACGTAGFLISAYKYILEHNKNESGNVTLTPDEKTKLTNSVEGYDISQDMVRFSRVNMYLHHFQNPKIYEYDTLTSLDRWDDQFDVILANPPFMTPKGGINPHNRFRVQAKRSEVLFVDYIAEHLTPGGRAGIVVPEGIVFQSQNAYKELRKFLVDDKYLYAVISLPAGVFNPYSGVKTSILLFDKTIAKLTNDVLFVKVENDGYNLGAQRREVSGSGIPRAVEIINKYKRTVLNEEQFELTDEQKIYAVLGEKVKIADEGYVLTGERYRSADLIDSEYPIVSLEDICEIISGQSPVGSSYNESGDGTPFYQGKTEFTNKFLGEPQKWTTEPTKITEAMDILMSVRAPVGPVNLVLDKVCIGRGLAAIRVKKDLAAVEYVFEFLRAMQEQINGNSGSTFASINRNDIAAIKIPLPPLDIQQQIVLEIESYLKIIDGAWQVVENYKSEIKVNGNWELCSLKNLVSIKTGKIDVNKAVENGKYPFFTCAKEPYYINEYAFDCEALMLAGNNATADYDVKYYNGKFNAYQRTYVITIDDTDKIDYAYLKFIMESKLGDLKRDSIGSQTKYLTLSVIQKLDIPLPTLEIQQKIVARIEEEQNSVSECKKLIVIFEQKIKEKISDIWSISDQSKKQKVIELPKRSEEGMLAAARNCTKEFAEAVKIHKESEENE